MKAITYDRYGGPEVIQVKEVPKPKAATNQVLIRVHCCSINPYDWHFMRGTPYFLRFQFGLLKPKQPILGSDIAGEVIEVGDGVNNLKVGDEVIAGAQQAGFAELVAVDASRVTLAPKGFSLAQSAGMIMAGVTAHEAVHSFAAITKGDRVLINGASGGVGHFAAQMAHATGAHVTGVCSGKNADWVKGLGANEVIDYTKEDLQQCGKRFDVVLDVNGNLTIPVYRNLLHKEGRVSVVGFNGMPDMMKKMWQQQFGKLRLHVVQAEENQKNMQAIVALAEAGTINTYISRTYSMDQFAEAIDHLEQGHAVGKVIVEMPVEGKS